MKNTVCRRVFVARYNIIGAALLYGWHRRGCAHVQMRLCSYFIEESGNGVHSNKNTEKHGDCNLPISTEYMVPLATEDKNDCTL